jgi:hypothetical protein
VAAPCRESGSPNPEAEAPRSLLECTTVGEEVGHAVLWNMRAQFAGKLMAILGTTVE